MLSIDAISDLLLQELPPAFGLRSRTFVGEPVTHTIKTMAGGEYLTYWIFVSRLDDAVRLRLAFEMPSGYIESIEYSVGIQCDLFSTVNMLIIAVAGNCRRLQTGNIAISTTGAVGK